MFWRACLDELDEVLRSVASRRGRTTMLVMAVALSVGTSVASLGLGRTTAEQIAADLAATIQDEVTLSAGHGGGTTTLFPPDAEGRALALSMVEEAGLRLDLDAGTARLARPGVDLPAGPRPAVWAVTEGYLRVIGAEHAAAWAFDGATTQPVALVGRGAAETLGLTASSSYAGASVLVAGQRLAVVGTVASTTRDLDDVVLVPYPVGTGAVGGDRTARLIVRTAPGAGARVADALALAVRPDMPASLAVSRVVDLAQIRDGVDSSLGRVTAMLGAVLVAITGLLIGNTTATAVNGRTAEIGLRRALGASTGAVVRLFLGEGALVGLLGGVCGAALGGAAVVLVSWANAWSAVLDPGVLVLGGLLGLLTGTVASAAPAAGAARILPAHAVRLE